ncbi:MAG: 50S ribosomal protein L25/general stress protein Ctc [Zetaproteobacteria bacterium]|nr:MAG: 50S ribosomal protein L25/general stress protein Ctc [Zetaproteobacteria bacterium]
MTNQAVLEAELREKTGKAEARRLRRSGKVPAIIYGGGKPDLPIALNFFEITKRLDDEAFHTSMIEIKVKGVRGKQTALLKSAQYDPLKDTVTHLDFQRVAAGETVTVEVPVHAVNYEKCPGVVAGGTLEVIRHTLEVESRADSIPEAIEVDCSALDLGDSIHIDDITLPEGCVVHHDVNFTVITIATPSALKGAGEESEEEAPEEEA